MNTLVKESNKLVNIHSAESFETPLKFRGKIIISGKTESRLDHEAAFCIDTSFTVD